MTTRAKPDLFRHWASPVLWITGWMVACAAPAPQTAPLQVLLSAKTALGEPMPKVRAWLNGTSLGTTGRDGNLRARRRVPTGRPADLTLACPAGYVTSDPERRLAVRDAGAGVPLRVSVVCRATTPMAALVVRSEPETPILVDGERVGQTDAVGIGHVLLRTQPGTTIQVALDTSSRPRLRPRNPVRTFDIGDHDELLLLDQPLHRPRRARRPRPRAPKQPLPRRRPTEIH